MLRRIADFARQYPDRSLETLLILHGDEAAWWRTQFWIYRSTGGYRPLDWSGVKLVNYLEEIAAVVENDPAGAYDPVHH